MNKSPLIQMLEAIDPTGLLVRRNSHGGLEMPGGVRLLDEARRQEKRERRKERLARRNQGARPIVETYHVHGLPDHQFVYRLKTTKARRSRPPRTFEALVHDPECSRCSEERERAQSRFLRRCSEERERAQSRFLRDVRFVAGEYRGAAVI